MLNLKNAKQFAEVVNVGTLTLKDPTTDERLEGVTISLIGAHTKEAKRIRREIANKRAKLGDGDNPSQAMEDDSCEFLARCTRGWTEIGDDTGNLDCTLENAIDVYHVDWIRRQIDTFATTPKNFGAAPLVLVGAGSSPSPVTSSDSPAASPAQG